MKRATQWFRSAEEHSCFGWGVDPADALEDHVPVGPAKICRCSQTSDGVLLGVCIVDHDVRRVVGLDLGGEILNSC